MTQSVASRIFSFLSGLSLPIAAIRPLPSTRMSGPAARASSPGSPVMIAMAFLINTLGFRHDFGFVPAAQRELREHHHQQEQQHAGERDEEQRREEARDVDREAGL